MTKKTPPSRDLPLPVKDADAPDATGATGATEASDERAAERPLPVAETFLSLQGEGKLLGTPSFFVRVAGCNLRCVWCDTPYASWNPEGRSRSIEDLVEEARSASVRHVVLTGGEPMIFPQITPLTRRLRAAGLHVTIETAGTVDRDVACDLMSISPKLSNSAPSAASGWRERHEARRLDFDAIRALLGRAPQRQIKFVVTDARDLPEIDAILAKLPGLAPEDVLLMPEGTVAPSAERKAAVVDLCLRRGWRYAPRLHIELFGHTRGT